MSSDDERDEKELDLTSPEVVTKYMSAAESVNSNALSLSLSLALSLKGLCVYWFWGFGIAEALQVVLAECKPGAKIVDICEKGDAFIKESVSFTLSFALCQAPIAHLFFFLILI